MPLISDELTAQHCVTQPRRFSVLYKRYIKKIYGYIRIRVNSVEDAEDLTSTVFTKAFQAINQYDSTRPFHTWLFTIARNCLIDFWRIHRTVIDITTVEYDPKLQQPPVDIDTTLLTEKILAELSGEERYLLSLRFLDGLSYQQISELTGKETNYLMVQFHRLKKKLQHIYEQ